MKTKEEILEKISEIIDNSKDEQIILNASHFLYTAILGLESEKKMEADREKTREKMKPLVESFKCLTEV